VGSGDSLVSAPSYGGSRGAGRLPISNSQSARQAIGKHIHFAVVGRARIRLSLRINILLTTWGNLQNGRGLFNSV